MQNREEFPIAPRVCAVLLQRALNAGYGVNLCDCDRRLPCNTYIRALQNFKVRCVVSFC